MTSLNPKPVETSAPRWLDPSVLVATCGGVGRIGVAPGTFGALVGLLVATGLARAGLPTLVELGLLLAVNLIGIPCCTRAARLLGLGKDPGMICYDEAASLPLALVAVPAAARSPLALVAAFVLHRAFDISKPFPCRRLERLPAGLGIMADDWGAAAYAAASLAMARWSGWL